jgi:hypothetical protein
VQFKGSDSSNLTFENRKTMFWWLSPYSHLGRNASKETSLLLEVCLLSLGLGEKYRFGDSVI